MSKMRGLISVLLAILQQMLAIAAAGRDLVLTPKQALQLSGKRIYYEQEQLPADTARAWEHTLRHVTYVTLFTDAAVGAAAGNLSQLHDYHEFLQTPYVPATAQSPAQSAASRFGDIVTLASGRLEQLLSNGSYRFVEGYQPGQPGQAEQQQDFKTLALWRVQRIRHRDGDTTRGATQRYHYEMKFSVSPLAANINWPAQSYIQKEIDYPQSFGRLVYEDKRGESFAQRRQDRQQPQATFVRGIFQAPPNLNIGEYLKEVPKIAATKLELHPGLFNLGLRPNYIAATTFRPSYPHKFLPRPDLSTPLERFPLPDEYSGGAGGRFGVPGVDGAGVGSGAADTLGVPGAPITHHFHHHFYMPPATGLGSKQSDLGYRPSTFVPELTTPLPPAAPIQHHHHHHKQQLELEQQHEPDHVHHREVRFPAHSSAASAESLETGEDQHSLLRSPQDFVAYDPANKYHTAKLPPLLIYAGGATADADAGEEQKTFVQSEPLEETIYRYSEPDPLYEQHHPLDVLHLETPHSNKNEERKKQQQQPQTGADPSAQLELEANKESEQQQREQRPAGSEKQPKLVTTPAPAASTTTLTTTMTTPAPAPALSPIPTAASKAGFVSSSTSITPLRALSRYRTTPRITAGRSTTTTTTTTTTESPLLLPKWKQRRKENATSVDSKAKSSHRYESKIIFVPTTTTTPATTTAPELNNSSTAAAPVREVVEVLTQKSVSKSVSIKVGENGEEIPIIVDDVENEVKRT